VYQKSTRQSESPRIRARMFLFFLIATFSKDNLPQYSNFVNPCGDNDQLIVHLNIDKKIAERSEAKSAKRSFASKIRI